ncbi:MAG TPA: MFS transporter [Candidatus Paceibacterota bacterium]|nr:MFS transporter [Candidatus Paceibacterota bacterium]
MRRLREVKHRLPRAGSRWRLGVMSGMVFFFVIFDGIIMYLAPIVMQNAGVSLGTIGLLLGLSSVAGMCFDVILLRALENTGYRAIFSYMFLVALTVPYFLFAQNTVTFYLLAMAAWGLYYNLYFIGSLDFVRQSAGVHEHTSSFGVLKVFEGLGYLLAPFFGSLVLLTISAAYPMPAWIFLPLMIAFMLFMLLALRRARPRVVEHKKRDALSTLVQIGIWRSIGRVIFPLLLLTLIINLVDAAVWTIGPLFSESLSIPGGLTGGAFMLAYTIPPLIVGWFVGSLVARRGAKRVGMGSLLIGSLLLIPIGVMSSAAALVGAIFLVSIFFSLIWPTINGAFEDTIAASPQYHEEIETIGDWFTNIGDTLGPMLGGYAAQIFGVQHSFAIMGICGVLVAIILLRATPPALVQKIVS